MDALSWPVVGALARHRHGRLALQVPLLLIAVIVVAHGLFGPRIAPRNLATVAVWIHYRGLLVLALLAAGNLFCTGCPMILVRDGGRRLFHPALRWPRVLRNKWIAIGLFAAVLFSYELFDLWDLPRATAWLVIAYFATALVTDTIFAGATFCKYLCPVGQFNFVTSTMSPTSLEVKSAATCRSCATADCIKGRSVTTGSGRPERARLRGCELGLFLPAKVGNLDCTLCLDCVRACPHDNIALSARVPGDELADGRRRSGISRLIRRPDIAVLVVIFTFGALLNAFAMTRPAAAVERWMATVIGVRSEAPVLALLFFVVLFVLPAPLVAAAAVTATRAGRSRRSMAEAAVEGAFALVPFGAGAWVAHYAFHLLTGVFTIVPVTQSALIDATGRAWLGEPLWRWAGMRPGSVFPLQLGCLLLGAIGSIGLASRLASRDRPERRAMSAWPWQALIVLLTAAAIWILAQPMDMRGVGFGA